MEPLVTVAAQGIVSYDEVGDVTPFPSEISVYIDTRDS